MELATQDSACADGLGLTAAVELVLTTPAHEGPVYIAGAADAVLTAAEMHATQHGYRVAGGRLT
jgi:hypothetical protein